MHINNEGFLQPHIESTICAGCHLCERVCPQLSPLEHQFQVDSMSYALINKDKDVLVHSSSGGVFFALAKWTIDHNGVVFGAKFEGIHVQHDYSDTFQGIKPFMGSKYIQSEIGNTYNQAKKFLQEDRWVLFSGTPCQVAGLKCFLQRDYQKLITLDFMCHGVPSPRIWEKYMTRLIRRLEAKATKDIRFRIKTHNPTDSSYYFHLYYMGKDNIWHEYGDSNTPYYSLFRRLIYRESCLQCHYRYIAASGADFTCGDCTNVSDHHPNLPINQGVSFLVLQSPIAYSLWEDIKDSFVYEAESIEIMKERYSNLQEEIENARHKRNWRLSNRLAQFIPLDKMQLIFMHDKPSVVIGRKLQKLFKILDNAIKTNS